MSLSNSLPMRRNKIPPQKTGLLPRPWYLSRGTGAKRFHALSTRVEGTNGIYPLGKGKGDGDHQVKDARDIAHKARAERAEVEELREQMGALHAIVEKQAAQLSQQSKTMELLRLYMKGRQSPMIEAISEEEKMAKSRFLNTALTDRRSIGMFDTRYHSASSGATPKDFRILPQRIILVRHAESEGNVDNSAYTYLPDPQVRRVCCFLSCLCVHVSRRVRELPSSSSSASPSSSAGTVAWIGRSCACVPPLSHVLYQHRIPYTTGAVDAQRMETSDGSWRIHP